jgi:hypothetical protein
LLRSGGLADEDHGLKKIVIQTGVAGQHQVVQNGQAAEQFQVLEGAGDPQLGHLVGRRVGQAFVAIQDLSLGGVIKAGDAVQHAGFAGPVGADDGSNQPWLNGHADIGKGIQAAKGEGNVLDR